ncbi:hypothetical protein DL98DRAFT_620973 [Cadophora sp. DSE1049]|nr:hypothetical protein DL98DRAFT_620973 [Cadophora sp. DSE1049]
MARGAQLRRGSSPDSDNDIDSISESNSNSNSDHDSNHESESEASEPEQPSQRRRDLRWLHAGLFKDARGEIKDVWYAFKKDRRGRYKIIYASDWLGTAFENLDVGRRKSDLITWDKHHSDKWSRFITARGTWVCKRATVGRAVQRDSLLQTWFDPNSPNLYRHGKDRDRTLGPPLNVIHTTADNSPKGSTRKRLSTRQPELDSGADLEECYPGTAIPFSTIKIVVGAYKDCDTDPLTVIADFLTGQLARHPTFRRQRIQRNDQIESAFYECGWRLSRSALEQANDFILLGKVENVFQSKAWSNAPPLWVDRFKGDRLNTMLTQMRDDMGEHGDSGDNSDDESFEPAAETNPGSDSEGQQDEDRYRSLATVAGPSKSKTNPNVSKAVQPKSGDKVSSKPSRSTTFSKTVTKRLWKSIEFSESNDSTDEELDYLPENSREKGKGRAVKKARVRKQIAEVSSDEEDDEEEVQVAIAKHSFSPAPVNKVKSAVLCIDSSDGDSDIEILEDLSTPVGLEAEKLPYYDTLQPANVSASHL